MQIITPYFIFKVCIFTYITFRCEKYLSSEVPLEVNQEKFPFLNDSLILNHCTSQAVCTQRERAKEHQPVSPLSSWGKTSSEAAFPLTRSLNLIAELRDDTCKSTLGSSGESIRKCIGHRLEAVCKFKREDDSWSSAVNKKDFIEWGDTYSSREGGHSKQGERTKKALKWKEWRGWLYQSRILLKRNKKEDWLSGEVSRLHRILKVRLMAFRF